MDIFDLKEYLVKYTLGKSRSVHELRIFAPNIVLARQEVLKAHCDGALYPRNFSAFQTLNIVSISDVS